MPEIRSKEKQIVIVLCSGGPDSLYLLYKLNKEMKYTLIVLHINYGFHSQSRKAEYLVRNICKKLNIELFVQKIESQIYSKIHLGLENIWRQIKLRTASNLAMHLRLYRHKNIKIASGHHQNDIVESYLIQQKRNAIPTYYGLQKQLIIKNQLFVRPLLHINKNKILQLLNKRKISYIEDNSNKSNLFLRNRIRKQISLYSEISISFLLNLIVLENIILSLEKLFANQCLLSKHKKKLNLINNSNTQSSRSRKIAIFTFLKANNYNQLWRHKKSLINEIDRQLTINKEQTKVSLDDDKIITVTDIKNNKWLIMTTSNSTK